METKKCILTRRSVRKFTDKEISDKELEEIIQLSTYAPSWKNSQTVRYFAIRDKKIKSEIANSVNGFEWNTNIINGADILVVECTVNGISGYNADGTPTSSKGTHWQSFDAGLSAQTLCLAARNLEIGSVILGIFNEEKIKQILNLDDKMSISSLIALGYYDELPQAPARKPLSEVLTVI